jgi:spore cortex formation protein SpoVR/YcgB (stage V sporulation)
MKSKKLLDKLNQLIGLEEDEAGKKEVRKLRQVLHALKEKQDKLKARLEQAEAEHERRKIQQKLEVIQRQREKGLEVYKALREARD